MFILLFVKCYEKMQVEGSKRSLKVQSIVSEDFSCFGCRLYVYLWKSLFVFCVGVDSEDEIWKASLAMRLQNGMLTHR